MYIVFKNVVLTLKKTQPITNKKINWLTLLKETIAVYFENHKKPVDTLSDQNAELLIVEAY
jgi:hypothetical protein